MKQDKYFISVGEPWDFESQDGQNIIKGIVLSIKSDQCLVFKSNYCLQFGEVEGFILVLTPRYNDNDFSDLARGKNVVVNGSLLLGIYNEEESKEKLLENAKFEMVGSLHIE